MGEGIYVEAENDTWYFVDHPRRAGEITYGKVIRRRIPIFCSAVPAGPSASPLRLISRAT